MATTKPGPLSPSAMRSTGWTRTHAGLPKLSEEDTRRVDDVVLDAVWLAGGGEPALLGACCGPVPLTVTGAATLEPVGMSGVRVARVGSLEEDAHKHLVRSAIGRLRAAGLVKLVYGRCYKLTAKGWRRRCKLRELLPKDTWPR